jgi:hypothetical protein
MRELPQGRYCDGECKLCYTHDEIGGVSGYVMGVSIMFKATCVKMEELGVLPALMAEQCE